jgi:hypothetical protein
MRPFAAPPTAPTPMVRDWQATFARVKAALMRRGRSEHDADDLVQEAWVRLACYEREHAVATPEAFVMRAAPRDLQSAFAMGTKGRSSIPQIMPSRRRRRTCRRELAETPGLKSSTTAVLEDPQFGWTPPHSMRHRAPRIGRRRLWLTPAHWPPFSGIPPTQRL